MEVVQVNLLIPASIGVVLLESFISRRFRSTNQHSDRRSYFFDRYYFWIMALAISFCFFVGILLTKVLNLPRFTSPLWAALGIGLIIIGYILRFYAIAALDGGFSVILHVASDQKLIATGPYAYVRHPSYSGSLLAILGLGVISGDISVLVFLLLATVSLMLVRIKREETMLSAHLAGYAAYRAHTRSLIIPWIL